MSKKGNEICALARKSLAAYAKTMWEEYLAPWHVLKLCEELERVERGETKRLIVCLPPRHSKTLNVGEYFPGWYLGRHPDRKIIYTTYDQDEATDHGRRVRNQLSDPLHHAIFPTCHLSDDSKAKKDFNTIEGGSYHAVGRGSAVTGKGAHVLVLDDMFKDDKEAASPVIREQLKKWFKAVAFTRLQKDGAIVLCGTRWHEDDLIGWALKELKDQNWRLAVFPARDAQRKPLWEEMFTDSALAEIERTLGPYFWNALYMQRPSAAEGNVFKRENWRRYKELPPRFDVVIQSWDMAFKEGKRTSYVVGQVWGKVGPDKYLIDQVRRRMGFTESLKALLMLSEIYPQAKKKLIEDKANGPAIMDILKRKVSGIVSVEPGGSKLARAEAVAYMQESGNVYIPDAGIKAWVEEYVDELANFPNADNDDQVDATTQALSHLGDGSPVERLKRLLGDLAT